LTAFPVRNSWFEILYWGRFFSFTLETYIQEACISRASESYDLVSTYEIHFKLTWSLCHLPGISVTLRSHNLQQNEYVDNDDPLKLQSNYIHPPPGRVTLRYVEVVADAEFVIKCEVEAPYRPTYDISFTAEVDGTRIATNVAQYGHVNNGYWCGFIDGYYKRIDPQRVSCRPLQFCGLIKG